MVMWFDIIGGVVASYKSLLARYVQDILCIFSITMSKYHWGLFFLAGGIWNGDQQTRWLVTLVCLILALSIEDRDSVEPYSFLSVTKQITKFCRLWFIKPYFCHIWKQRDNDQKFLVEKLFSLVCRTFIIYWRKLKLNCCVKFHMHN